ncbi:MULTISPECIES: TonB-dependent receptor domain-containing protein [unclassified Sphingobium]|uniref:TonB-dependent receptor domain-containing protein n=1 Tax=unclassified Sphingobium TaxID=2611147 RepID=UPI002225530E|nr:MULTISPECIES: TonB-dependent receptor [unclassified Sphingobium]MCW2394643.1 outer membrane receptor protein involved in Fe transport [Sphingobium sp. B8D3B]MCW2418157.1 outer membrane receptor protein involved in Fe transport [Sphingobium sp. B8D3C]
MSPFITRSRVLRAGAGASLSALALGMAFVATPAFAQDAAQPQDDEAGEAIIVTGSRIARTGFDQPTPVSVVGGEQIARQAAVNVAQVLNELPSFRPQATPSTNAIFANNIGASTADLRGLGANRTLVLINGRRVVASTVQGSSFANAGAVDLNIIPTSLVERVDVVTGGASAAYGSDAVAGVVNVILDTNLTGLKGSAQYGINDAGDGKEYQFALAGGMGFAGGRGHIIAGVEYSDNKGTDGCYSRDWCSLAYNTVANPLVNPANRSLGRVGAGLPATLILPNTRTATASYNGLIVSGPAANAAAFNASGLRGMEFRPDGTLVPHDYGTYYGVPIFQSGGGDARQAFYENFPIAAPVERLNGFTHLKFEVADGVELFAEGSYSRVNGSTVGAQRRDLGSLVIRADNAFLPDSVAATMASVGLPSFNMGRVWNDLGPQRSTVKRDTYRAVVGINAEMWGDWKFDAYYQFGRTDYWQRGYNTSITPRLQFAIDAVDQGEFNGGPANGNIVCRATLQGNPAAAGCVPLNPFGENNFSAAAKAWTHGTVEQDTRITQNVVAASMNGTLFQGWAGPIKAATGVELRQDIARGNADAISRALQFYTGPGAPIDGKVDVFEAFGELDVPVAPGVYLNGALRYTDYSTSGDVMTWKVGVEASPLDWLRVRATRSRDIRAPNLFELFGPLQTSFQNVRPSEGGQVLTSVLLGGDSTLVPEEADTFTVGVVLQPDLGSAGRLRFSIDYFDIKLDKAVSQLGAQVIVDGCERDGIQEYCSLITRGPVAPGRRFGDIQSIVNTNVNLGSLITRGWDIEAAYTLPVNLFGGSISLRGMATIIDDLITNSASGTVDRAGMNGSPVSQPSGMPRYIINGYVTFNAEPATLQVQVRHISSGTYNNSLIGPGQYGYDPNLDNSVNDNYIAPWTYVNLNGSVAVWNRGDQKMEIFGAINNLFDKDPPVDAPSSFGPTNNVLYDVVGRSYRIGARFKF